MNNELFELCQEVYEKTKWKTGKHIWSMKNPKLCRGDNFLDGMSFAFYSSDYLLEKLPQKIVVDDETVWISLYPMDSKGAWGAGYSADVPESDDKYGTWADDKNGPLKALLKLTIALHEAGELK